MNKIFESVDTKNNIRPRLSTKLSALLIGGSAVLFACGSSVEEGEVIGVRHEDARTWTQLVPIPHTSCSTVNKITTCTTWYSFIPMVHHDDEDWVFTLRDCNGGGEPSERDCKTGDVYVSEQVYKNYQVGDYFFGSDMQVEDPIVQTEE